MNRLRHCSCHLVVVLSYPKRFLLSLSELSGTVVEALFKCSFKDTYIAANSYSLQYRCIYESFLCLFQVGMFSPAKKKVSYTGHARVRERMKALSIS